MKTDLDEATRGTCENCNIKDVWVRRIPSFDWLTRRTRRYWDICFNCFGPIRIWNGPHGETKSPLGWSKEKTQKYLKDGQQ